jgi:hypothetical protein
MPTHSDDDPRGVWPPSSRPSGRHPRQYRSRHADEVSECAVICTIPPSSCGPFGDIPSPTVQPIVSVGNPATRHTTVSQNV